MGDVNILTIAMHDTTASTMSFCLTELARRPTLQDDLYVEVTQVLNNNAGEQRPMTYDDLNATGLKNGGMLHPYLR